MNDYEPTKIDRVATRLIDAAIKAGLDARTIRADSASIGEAEAYIRDCGRSWITMAVRVISVRVMRDGAASFGPIPFGKTGALRLGEPPPVDDELRDALAEHLGRLLEYEKPSRPMFVSGGGVVTLGDLHAAMRDYDTVDKRIIAATYTAVVWFFAASAFGFDFP